jgi:hypothetical protein
MVTAQDFFPRKVCGQDSVTQMSKLRGKWKYTGYYTQEVYGGPFIKKPVFNIGDTGYVFMDTFVNYSCTVERIQNYMYLYEEYNFKKVDTNAVCYRYMFSTKTLPISVKKICRNPYYTLENEFIIYKDTVYYDLNGIIYKFRKI